MNSMGARLTMYDALGVLKSTSEPTKDNQGVLTRNNRVVDGRYFASQSLLGADVLAKRVQRLN